MKDLTIPQPQPACGPRSAASYMRYRPRCSAGSFLRTSPAVRPRSPLVAPDQHRHRRVPSRPQHPHRPAAPQRPQHRQPARRHPPEAVAGGRVRTAVEYGFLDISTFRPELHYGHAIVTVDGQLEKVLSSHQIQCGKLVRVDKIFVRDAFDDLTAAQPLTAATSRWRVASTRS